jgi:LL-diaminopimelate aminotransferase
VANVETTRSAAVTPSRRVAALRPYAFAEVDRLVQQLRSEGVTPIDFGVGDPTVPTPALVREATRRAVDAHATSGYPSYVGSPEFRGAVAAWMKRRFSVDLDPQTEITSSAGSKELIFNLHEGFVDPGDVVIVPSPGYPPYSRGTLFAEGRPYFYPVEAKNGFLPDLGSIPGDVLDRAKLMWICYPNSPTGALAPRSFLRDVVAFCRDHGILLFSDEAYSEIYFGGEKPISALEIARDGVASVFSMSKRSAMTGYRIGWIAGDRRIVDVVKKVKTNIDSGTPNFVQDGAIAALSDETHVAAFREEYRAKRDVLVRALVASGLDDCTPEATMYVWQRVPRGWDSAAFAKRLLAPDLGLVATPGGWISDPLSDGRNPGDAHVRFALVPTVEETREAARRLSGVDFRRESPGR